MKKLNLKQPKYIFPLVILLPLTALAYTVTIRRFEHQQARCHGFIEHQFPCCGRSGDERQNDGHG